MEKERTILIVDDMEVNRLILKEIFQDEYNIEEAGNGKEALEILESGVDISAILLDIMMPVMDGIEFLHTIKAIPQFSSIPVLVNTQSGEEKNEILVLELGADDFIIKPYNAGIVKRRVRNVITKYVLEREKLEKELEDTKLQLDSIVNTVPGGIATFELSDHIRNIYYNDGMSRLLEYTNAEMRAISEEEPLQYIVESQRQAVKEECLYKARKDEPVHMMFEVETKNGNHIWLEMNAVKFKEENKKKIYHAIFTDATAEKKMRDELEYRALHDMMTGIYNQETFYEICEEILKHAKADEYDITYWNIQRFKGINDLFGKETGDKVIVLMAQFLKNKFGVSGICARLSADQFVCLCKKGTFDYKAVIEELHTELKTIGIYYDISVLCGLYEISDVTVPVSLMCDRAKLASEKIRNNFLHPIGIFHEPLRETYLVEQELIGEMERALKNGDFYINLQPIYDTITGKPVSAEALVRWKHSEKGMISPGIFIPLFEQNGFITELDDYVWEQVCKMLSEMKENGEKIIPVSINLSRLDFFEEDICEKIDKVVKKYHLEPWMLKLEVTESAYTDNSEQLIETIRHLQSKGFEILMDDFGSGYSSLNMLKDVPVDILKVDMHFIDQLENSERGANILISINRMAKLLNMIVVAEGVETKYQYEFMREIGCDRIQGYYFSKPVSVEEYRRIVAQEAEDTAEVRPQQKERLTVMLVDDMTFMRRALSRVLENDYNIVEAKDGREALEILRSREFRVDLVVTDIIMPVMDGMEMLQTMKQDPSLAGIPILVVSDLDDAQSERKVLEAGAMDFIRKPFDGEALLHKIRNLLKLSDMERLNQELKIMREMTERDGLTSLMNRITFQKRVDEIIRVFQDGEGDAAFIMLDIDSFKMINDKYGHLFGDKVLIAVADNLRRIFRQDDIIARLGGDEFAVFIRNGMTREIMERRMEIISENLKMHLGEEEEILVTCSVGLAFYPEAGCNFTQLYHSADSALYKSKRKGKGLYTIYEPKTEN